MNSAKNKYSSEKIADTLLAVDADDSVNERETPEWLKYGIQTVHAATMSDAIAHLVRGGNFLVAVINEDSVHDYLTQLPVMRDAANTPIFVITSHFTCEKKIKALHAGADAYDRFCKTPGDNVVMALEILKAQIRLEKFRHKTLPVLIGGDIILSQPRRAIFVKNKEISLPRKEFDILRYLMTHGGYVIPHTQLLHAVWGEEYGEKDTNVLWRGVDRLRKTIASVSPETEYIKVDRGVGYKFLF